MPDENKNRADGTLANTLSTQSWSIVGQTSILIYECDKDAKPAFCASQNKCLRFTSKRASRFCMLKRSHCDSHCLDPKNATFPDKAQYEVGDRAASDESMLDSSVIGVSESSPA